jgi:flavin-dependent dehydrogenase
MKVAIVGAGPAGSALGILLVRQGADVTLFDDGRRPELLVGESLVPAVVPILKRLGVEDTTAGFSRVKPGVSFIWSPTDRFSFTFARFAPDVFPYAYNIPRPQFDEAVLDLAVKSGVERVVAHARLTPCVEPGRELALAPETLAAAPALGGRQPDLIVHATGRARLGARALGIGAHLGPRKDVAHFAHFEHFDWDDAPGQVLIRRLDAGWAWCIPLQARLSVGIVLDRDDAARLGALPEERLERAIASDPWLVGIAGKSKRVTSVATSWDATRCGASSRQRWRYADNSMRLTALAPLVPSKRLPARAGSPCSTSSQTLNAVPFYQRVGFRVEATATHRVSPEVELACVAMRKELAR